MDVASPSSKSVDVGVQEPGSCWDHTGLTGPGDCSTRPGGKWAAWHERRAGWELWQHLLSQLDAKVCAVRGHWALCNSKCCALFTCKGGFTKVKMRSQPSCASGRGVSPGSPAAHRQRRLHREQHRSHRMHESGTCQQTSQRHKGDLTAQKSTEVGEWVGSRKK